MNPWRTWQHGFTLSLLCIAIAGCGGDDGTRSTSGTSERTVARAPQQTSNQAPNQTLDQASSAGPAFAPGSAAGLFANASGVLHSYSTAGPIDRNGPFFKTFGNGRSCASCHEQSAAFSVTPQGVQRRFEASDGLDPIFRLNDGANSPLATVGTLAERRAAYSMLLNRGVIRVGLPVPADAEFELVQADDPYHYASARELSLFRRILPSANLKFLGGVMWDGRESAIDPNSSDCFVPLNTCYASIDSNLLRQANNATRGHAEAARDLSSTELRQIVDFENSLFAAQSFDHGAHHLAGAQAQGGTATLLTTEYYFDINDLFRDPRTGQPGRKEVFQLFGAWLSQPGRSPIGQARQSIARGEVLFNTRSFDIVGVAGVNDLLGPRVVGTCSTCHNVPQVGSFSLPNTFNIGVADGANRTPDMPLYTLRNKRSGELLSTQDPGAAMQTGRWGDIGRFKAPGLRALAARAPYFHDGSAGSIEQVMAFYERRFQLGLSSSEQADLVAFLKAL